MVVILYFHVCILSMKKTFERITAFKIILRQTTHGSGTIEISLILIIILNFIMHTYNTNNKN